MTIEIIINEQLNPVTLTFESPKGDKGAPLTWETMSDEDKEQLVLDVGQSSGIQTAIINANTAAENANEAAAAIPPTQTIVEKVLDAFSPIEEKVEEIYPQIFDVATSTVGFSNFTGTVASGIDCVCFNRNCFSEISGKVKTIRGKFSAIGSFYIVVMRKSGLSYSDHFISSAANVATAGVTLDIDVRDLDIDVQIGDAIGLLYLTADSPRAPVVYANTGNPLHASAVIVKNVTTGKYAVGASYIENTSSAPYAGLAMSFDVIVEQSVNNIEEIKYDIEGLKANEITVVDSEVRSAANVTLQYLPARGISELIGNSTYSLNGMSMHTVISKSTIFNRIEFAIYGGTDTVTELRLYKGNYLTLNPSGLTLLHSKNYLAGQLGSNQNEPNILDLNEYMKLNAGEYLYLFLYASAGSLLTIRRFTTPESSPVRNRFMYKAVTANPFTEAWTLSSADYYAPDFRLSLIDREIDRKLSDIKSAVVRSPKIQLPSKIYACVGKRLNLHYNAIALMSSGIRITTSCSIGNGYGDFYTVTPAATGTYILTFTAWDYANNILEEKSTQLVVIAAAAPASPKNVLFLGDSNTSPGVTSEVVKLAFDAMGGSAVTFWGLSRAGTTKVTEGRDGWTFANFAGAGPTMYKFNVSGVTSVLTGAGYTNNGSTFQVLEVNITAGSGYINTQRVAGSNLPTASGNLVKASGTGDSSIAFSSISTVSGNPLWNGATSALDVANYRTAMLGMGSGTKFDCVYIQLGINDSGQQPTSVNSDTFISGIINNAKLVIAAFLADSPTCKIIVALTPACNSTGGGFPSERMLKYFELNIWKLSDAIIANFDNGVYSPNVSVAYTRAFVHRYYGYPMADVAVSLRYSGIVKGINTNSVHPRAEGYLEAGDSLFAHCLAMLQ